MAQDLTVRCLILTLLVTAAGCVSTLPPRVVMENSLTRVELRVDERSTQPHAHPIALSSDGMRALLSGLRIQLKQDKLMGVAAGWSEPVPVLSPTDITAMAAPLAEALARARPEEIVTFYRRISDASTGLAYTTGGLYIQEGLIYLVVANFRSLPSDAIVRDVPGYLTDAIDRPLLTLGRKFYRLSHQQFQAEVHLPQWSERYEEGKTLVINLGLLRQGNSQSAPPSPLRHEKEAGPIQ